MLITCPECKTEVSSQANTCPKCAYPLDHQIPSPSEASITVKRTGGKWEMIGTLMIVLAMGGCSVGLVSDVIAAVPISAIIFFGGVLVFIYGRFG